MNLGNRFSQHSFAQIPNVNIPRSRFDRSFAAKDTMDFDLLTPFFLDEIVPGDTVNLNVKTFYRMATQVVPFMDNAYLDFYFFFVPNRLVWSNWERFNGAQDDPGDSTDFLIPQTTTPIAASFVGSLADHMGCAYTVLGKNINALPFRAYNLIYNDWFRDSNLQDSLPVPKTDGPDAYTLYPVQYSNKKHDYFTSCLPWPQKGDAVTLPLGTSAPIVRVDAATNAIGWMKKGTNTPSATGAPSAFATSSGNTVWDDSGGTGINMDPRGTLEADLTAATAASINLFRQAMMMQSLLELDARGGTRYTEILRAHFGVVSPDARLQRPEFLSSATIPLNQHPVTQTSGSIDGETPQATLAAFTTASETGNKIGFTKSFVEHGYVLGLVRARADVTYQQGLNKLWSRRTRWDFFWPKFQELGEQAVLKQEVACASEAVTTNTEVFGYQERYAEYRYRPSEIRGLLRSDVPLTLDVWHLAQEFSLSPMPSLNEDFIKSSTPIDRNLAVTDQPALKCDYWFDYKHSRPMMSYGVPASLGRF